MNKKMLSASKKLSDGEIRTMEQNNVILMHGDSETTDMRVGWAEGGRGPRHRVRCASLSLWQRGWVGYGRYLKGVTREEIVDGDVRLSRAKAFASGQRRRGGQSRRRGHSGEEMALVFTSGGGSEREGLGGDNGTGAACRAPATGSEQLRFH